MIPAPVKLALDFIASFEAPRGYDTVYGNKMSRMPKPLTSMTIGEAIADGPRRTREFGSSACGRYQFMKGTLETLTNGGGFNRLMLMSPEVQDHMGYELLRRRGYEKFMSGKMSATDFGNQIAMEWASFPVLSAINGKRRGQSYYAGDGLNHVLVGPEPVERMLSQMRAASIVSVAEPQPVSAPRAATVSASTVPAPWWQTAFGLGRKPVAAKTRPGLNAKGSPDLWDIQAGLKDRGYYNTGLLDGLDGSKTQAAVAQIRKDNGLADGGIDAEFLAGLPSWPHARVSTQRAILTLAEASAHAPELFKPPAWLATVGTGLLGLGGASGSGLMDGVQGSVSKANDVLGQVQTAFGAAAGALAFVVEHKTWFLVGAGAFLLWKGVSAILGAWIKVRQAFF